MYYEVLLQEHVIWDTDLLIGILCIALLYILLLHRLRTIKMYQKHVILFLLVLGLLYITIGSPLSRISHFSFSLHMIQMSILYFIIPPIILLGIPNPMLDHILHRLK